MCDQIYPISQVLSGKWGYKTVRHRVSRRQFILRVFQIKPYLYDYGIR
ncbi:uncharacterized protein [Blastocystis hominis]|uniref:Uncharacterized protein n=1 Tax=Blastocystis hominis TaxID=12968 RepID=D8M812_BLAHO|nr:uncharacterized protein [Blastocystis hominis]CBK24201.2 unnamed protein product [Blastocystis hominis]|eukprot:XP_012898249.1 uncharacterized protein [Blastocystis hominis]